MGTSKSYIASIKGQPQWGQLSGSMTTNCNGDRLTTDNLNKIISRYVNVIGGSQTAGRGNSKIAGRAGLRTARNLGAFINAFTSAGNSITSAFQEIGLGDITGKTVDEVINALIEHCSGPASTIDDVAAKAASQKLLEEISAQATTIEQFEANLQQSVTHETSQDILIRYFGYYIFEHLSVMFYEKLVVDKGKSNCSNLFKQIKDFILEKLKTISKTNPLNNINWKGEVAERLIKNIQEDVLKIFEGYES